MDERSSLKLAQGATGAAKKIAIEGRDLLKKRFDPGVDLDAHEALVAKKIKQTATLNDIAEKVFGTGFSDN